MRGVVLLLGVTLAMLLAYAGVASAVDDIGYRDFSFNPAVAPTGEKPQSKLWFNDGTWWASMFNRTAEEFRIYRYDRATHTWSDTGTLIDERNSSKADTLWDGSHLYVATAGTSSTDSAHSARILRYSYDAVTGRYSLDPGFPVTGVSNGGMEAIVLDKDTTGKLWVTYTQNKKVYVNRSLGNDQTWGTPFVLPVKGTNVNSDDISAVIAFDSQIGVMWSNQTASAMYFATHKDGDADNVWQASRTAIQGPNYADDHISLRSLQVDDVSERVFAVVKTSLGDLQNPNPNAPLIFLLARSQDGTWTNHVFGRVSDNHTRPIMMIDEEHRNLYVFAAPCCDGGAIYYKKTALSNISFPDGLGTPFIQSATNTHINNPTSTKQNVNSATGLMVLASDDTSRTYLHNIMNLDNADTVAPTVSAVVPASGATDVAGTSNAEITFSEVMDSSTINGSTFTLVKEGTNQPVVAQVTYDPATKMAALDPEVNLDPSATYTATVKGGTSGVKDPAGNPLAQDKVWSFTTAAAPPPADTTPPETTIDSGPSDTITVDSASFAFSSSETGTTFECRLDGAAYSACTSPKDYTNLSNGSHTFEVRATDAAGNVDATPASRTFSVEVPPPPPADTTPPETTIDSGPSDTITVDSASFAFSSSETGTTFECRLDGAAYSACTSPKDYTNLSNGSHTFEVRATDAAGNVDATPASRTFSVEVPPPPPADTTPPETTIDSGPSETVNSSSANFAFSSDEAGSTFECKLDGGAFASCSSPKSYSNLSDGSHTFSVRATDPAGNTDASPASRTWTVSTAPGTTTSLTSTADTKLVENAPTTNYGGASPARATGDDPAGSGKDVYSLLRWNLSSLPAGSKVTSVSIDLNVTNASNQTYQLYEIKRSWVEREATWLLYASGSSWEVAGAKGTLDRGAQVGSVTPKSTGKQSFTVPASVVQRWIDEPTTNQGIIVASTTNTDAFDFSSREAATATNRPQLQLTYSAP